MSGHDARPQRRSAGHSLWWAHCPCGWEAPAASKEDAHARSLIHRNVKEALALVEADLPEACYDPNSMEYDPEGYPCLRCSLRGLLGAVA